jgi:AcrR family transcriptional regulator
MSAIVGGPDVEQGRWEPAAAPGTAAAAAAAAAIGIHPDGPEARVIDAVVACAGRWGIDKTTVDDVAREAGMSRATVYRLFPGGKPSIVHLATRREVVALVAGIVERVEACDDLTDALVEMVSGSTRAIEAQPAVAYMRAHDPASVRAFFSFERLAALFELAADLASPALCRFLDPDEAREVTVWVARLVVSHYLQPDPARPLADPEEARALVERHVLVGLATAASP